MATRIFCTLLTAILLSACTGRPHSGFQGDQVKGDDRLKQQEEMLSKQDRIIESQKKEIEDLKRQQILNKRLEKYE